MTGSGSSDSHQNNQASANLQKTKAELEGYLRIFQQDRNLTRSYIITLSLLKILKDSKYPHVLKKATKLKHIHGQ